MKFATQETTASDTSFAAADQAWTAVLGCNCTFEPTIFIQVLLNLIRNPNYLSTYVFRANILYDSSQNILLPTSSASTSRGQDVDEYTKHMKAEYRPLALSIDPSFDLERTIVRELIPRNTQLHKPVVQTCCLFQAPPAAVGTTTLPEDATRAGDIALAGNIRTLAIYLPHVQNPEDMPWYHPTVRGIAFLHTWKTDVCTGMREDRAGGDGAESDVRQGTVTIYYQLFPGVALDERLERTASILLQTMFKHGQGTQAGYVKQVHHDQLIPQDRYQDRYAMLKRKYARILIKDWVEQTDPAKHVFEDLGIAAFLIELWRDIYGSTTQDEKTAGEVQGNGTAADFPGFVDIGCGNGVLVHILLQEGYRGWGFDARRRKTWEILPPDTQQYLKETLLVPDLFLQAVTDKDTAADGFSVHDGLFPTRTFIISNHADELTVWTPLLARLSQSSFLAIPCCSHSLAGNRFRATMPRQHPFPPRKMQENELVEDIPTQASDDCWNDAPKMTDRTAAPPGGSSKAGRQPSAYASLCAYVSKLTATVGYVPEREVLRIPSTRNIAIIGRARQTPNPDSDCEGDEARSSEVLQVLERELGGEGAVQKAAEDWIARIKKLNGGSGRKH